MTFLAITALSNIVTQARKARVPPSPALRFILAWLYATGPDNDREFYDQFWKTVQDDGSRQYSECQANYLRGTTAQTCLNGIARRAGIELTADVMSQLRFANMRQIERRNYRATSSHRFNSKTK
ncbi:MAG: hypothetical protein Pars92KO_32600 [Parasphingorhabdus sp.]